MNNLAVFGSAEMQDVTQIEECVGPEKADCRNILKVDFRKKWRRLPAASASSFQVPCFDSHKPLMIRLNMILGFTGGRGSALASETLLPKESQNSAQEENLNPKPKLIRIKAERDLDGSNEILVPEPMKKQYFRGWTDQKNICRRHMLHLKKETLHALRRTTY